MIELDNIDRKIIRALCEDATQSAGALGRDLGLSQPATWRRIKRLREAGVFGSRRVDLDLEALGFGVTVFLGVKLATKGRVSLEDFERAVRAIPEVADGAACPWPVRLSTARRGAGLAGFRACVAAADHDASGRGERGGERRALRGTSPRTALETRIGAFGSITFI